MKPDFTIILAVLRERGPVELPRDSDADQDDPEDVSGYALEIDKDGFVTVWHWFYAEKRGARTPQRPELQRLLQDARASRLRHRLRIATTLITPPLLKWSIAAPTISPERSEQR